MNNKRPSKPNLPSVPKPSKLLLQRGCAEPISSLAYRIPLQTIASTNMKLVLSYCFPSTKWPSHGCGYGENMFW